MLELADMWAADIPAKLASKAVRVLSPMSCVGQIGKACRTSRAMVAGCKRLIKQSIIFRSPRTMQRNLCIPAWPQGLDSYNQRQTQRAGPGIGDGCAADGTAARETRQEAAA